MPIITQKATKKAKAIAYAVKVIQNEGKLSTGSQEHLKAMFEEGSYILKNNNQKQTIFQVSSTILYEHWKSGDKPVFYRQLSKGHMNYCLEPKVEYQSYQMCKNALDSRFTMDITASMKGVK